MKKIEIEDLLLYRFPENLQYNPSGTVGAFQTAWSRKDKNDYFRDVWLLKDGKPVQATASFSTTIVCWQDDTHLILQRSTEEKTQPGRTELFLLDINGGEAMPWTVLPVTLSGMKKVTDDLYVLTAAILVQVPDAYKNTPEQNQELAAKLAAEKDYTVIDENPWWFNGQGIINGMRNALFLYNAKTGRLKRVTGPYMDVHLVEVSGTTIYFSGCVRHSRYSWKDRIYVCDALSGRVSTFYNRSTHHIAGLHVIKGRLIAQATDMKNFGLEETPAFYEVTKNQLTLLGRPERTQGNAGSADVLLKGGKQQVVASDRLITLATVEDHIEIWRWNSSFTKAETLCTMPGTISFLDAGQDGITFCAVASDRPAELYAFSYSTKKITRLTHFNDAALEGKYVAKPRPLTFHSQGCSLKGWVLLPEGFSEKKKYPAVLDIHGGPRTIYTEAFFHEMQVWCARGFVVFFCNIFGSDGRGDEFADLRGKYGTIDYENLMDFTDAVLHKYPNISRNRLCVTGGSYGGYMTNWIIGHTDRFCCAASQRSISNWMSMGYTSDISPFFVTDQNGVADSADEAEVTWAHSPLKYASQARTPTLFIHSDEDRRCPISEGYQMMMALTQNGVETRMVVFHGENHELSRSGKPLHRIRRLQEITGWLESHAK